MKKILKSDKQALIIMDPNTNFTNLIQLNTKVQKMIEEQYYGTKRNVKNVFKNQKTNQEVFNLGRRIQMEIKQTLNKVLVVVDYQGKLRIKDTRSYDIS